jgi:hypothetical protein
MTAGLIATEPCWTNQEFSSVDIIPLWFSILIYNLEDERYARWLPQFRDVVSPHPYDRHDQLTD